MCAGEASEPNAWRSIHTVLDGDCNETERKVMNPVMGSGPRILVIHHRTIGIGSVTKGSPEVQRLPAPKRKPMYRY
jgi:hypothetical protein